MSFEQRKKNLNDVSSFRTHLKRIIMRFDYTDKSIDFNWVLLTSWSSISHVVLKERFFQLELKHKKRQF